jgi:mannose-1-phosphate guanylyltransferase/mannose-6-phosphate isomerase
MTSQSHRVHAVVLAGGSGSRFWPLSREMSPKQMLSIFGGVSLLARAIGRIRPFVGDHAIHVVCGERLFDELRNHLKAQPEMAHLEIDYMVEPSGRNTAPALALAAATIVRNDPDAVVVMLPSDHLLEEGERWLDTLSTAVDLAESGYLVTIGLRPTRPETGYGYIQAGDRIDGVRHGEADGHVAAAFIEKPDQAKAERLVAEGGFLWNSGMLVAKASVVLAELRAAGEAAATPLSAAGIRIVCNAQKLAALPRADWLSDNGRALYDALPSVPFDKAALEVSERVAVVPTDLEWSDVGSLLSIDKLGDADERGNVLVGRFFDVGSHGVLGYSADRLVATLGLDDVVVVDTADATLVAAKDRLQDVRLVVDLLKAAGAEEVVTSRHSVRPWGSWTLLMRGDGFQIKSIDVNPGKRLSIQSHAKRSEHWIVIDGVGYVLRDREVIEVRRNESVYLPIGTVHRLENRGDVPLKVVEVAVGDYLGEDDITRYEDDFGR